MPVIHRPKKEKQTGCKCRWKPWHLFIKEWTIWKCGKCGKEWIAMYCSSGGDGSQEWVEHEWYLNWRKEYAKRNGR